MRKIDKRKILSKEYSEWEKNLKEHPKYDSGHRFYIDIKMSLLYCQKGLCAYTEEVLCDPKFIKIENWDKGKYKKELITQQKYQIRGDLEHFDESLKDKQGFLWDNFFVVNTHNNCRVKGKKAIKKILKPDSKEYNPYKYLEFLVDRELDSYIFVPNSKLPEQEQDEVKYMIEVLGLNCVEYERKRQIKEWEDRYNLGLPVKPYRYVTAWEMRLEILRKK
jgi:hypothetical protein